MPLENFKSMVKTITTNPHLFDEDLNKPPSEWKPSFHASVDLITTSFNNLPKKAQLAIIIAAVSREDSNVPLADIENELELLERENKLALISMKVWFFKASVISFAILIGALFLLWTYLDLTGELTKDFSGTQLDFWRTLLGY